MPLVPPRFIQSVVYIYPTESEARDNTRDDNLRGGTAFLIGTHGIGPSDWTKESGPLSKYFVTAAHNVKDLGTRFLRLNLHKEKTEPLPIAEDSWFYQDHIAICPFNDSSDRFDVSFIPASLIITQQAFDENEFGPGDDVVMIGRFVQLAGKDRNIPSLRFGNISMLPIEPIPRRAGGHVLAFLVEMRSRGGFSGSPVFVYKAYLQQAPLFAFTAAGEPAFVRVRSQPYLLGIDEGQFPTYLNLVDKRTKQVIPDMEVEEHSAMTLVLPGWDLVGLLMREDLTEMRRNQ